MPTDAAVKREAFPERLRDDSTACRPQLLAHDSTANAPEVVASSTQRIVPRPQPAKLEHSGYYAPKVAALNEQRRGASVTPQWDADYKPPHVCRPSA